MSDGGTAARIQPSQVTQIHLSCRGVWTNSATKMTKAMREKNWNMNRAVKSVWVVLIAPHAGLVSGSSTQ